MDPVEALRETGYAVFPSLYGETFLARARREVVRLYEEFGSPHPQHRGKSALTQDHVVLSGAGLMIGRLLSRAPALAQGYIHPRILEVLREALGPDMRLETTAATISDEHRDEVLGWHQHIGGLDEDLERPVDIETLDPERIRRVTMLIYLDGLSDETGPLFVLPRALSDPIACPFPEVDYRGLEGGVVVEGPPGTAVVLEERTWHAARARKTPGFRRFVGAMLVASWAPAIENADPTAAGFEGRVLAC